MINYKIYSGFQSGADIGATRAAHAVGLPTGGWIPAGWRTEYGPRPEYGPMYGAVEHTSADWKPRTIANIRDSDATLIFKSTRARRSPGSDQTRESCIKLGKPYVEIRVWATPDAVPSTRRVAELIAGKGVKVLNCAGTRASSDPGEPGRPWTGIEGWVERYLFDVFTLLKEQQS